MRESTGNGNPFIRGNGADRVTPLPFQAEGDAITDLARYLPLVVLSVVLIGAIMWFLAFISRYFEYLKTVESRWLDRPTLDFIHRVLEVVWIAFIAIVILAVAQSFSASLRDVLLAFVQRVPALFFAIFVLFVAAIIVRALHRFGSFLRGELKTKPKRLAPPQALAFTEIVLKYLIYTGAVALAVFGGIRALPVQDQDFIQQNLGSLPGIPGPALIGVLVGVLVVGIADRFIDSIFEDWKRRTRKFSARVMDEFKTLARYAVWLLGAIVLLFIILALALTETQLVVFAVGFIAFLIAAAMIAFDPVRNLLAGITLMRADPFDIGDRIKIGTDLVCDVGAMSLTLTQVRTLRGEVVSLPNSRLLEEPIVNFSRSKPYAMSVEVCVDFAIGHAHVCDLLLRAARETEGIVPEPSPLAHGKDLEGSSIRYQLLAYTNQPERMKECKSALIYKIQELFGQANIRPVGPRPGASFPSEG